MSRFLERRLVRVPPHELQAGRQGRRRKYLLGADDTPETIRAKIRDLVESGHATEGDQFVTFGWKPPKDEAVGN